MVTLQQVAVSIIIGIVQGISEWLPISSKTQVLIASQTLLNLTFSQAYTFGLFMEVGTLIAAIIYFRRELWALIQVIVGNREPHKVMLLKYIVVTVIATGIIGAPIYLVADSITGIALGIPMTILGIILIGDALLIRHSRIQQAMGKNTRMLKDLSWKEYLYIGIAQGIAALPGVSRSGATTSTLLLLHVEGDEAFRLSFFTGIFATAGAFALTLVASKSNVTAALAGIGYAGLAIAIVAATIVSLFLIDFLIKVAGKGRIVYLTAGLGIIAIASGLIYLVLGL